MILCDKHRIHWAYYFNKIIPSVINFQNVSGYIQGMFKKKINCRAMPDVFCFNIVTVWVLGDIHGERVKETGWLTN